MPLNTEEGSSSEGLSTSNWGKFSKAPGSIVKGNGAIGCKELLKFGDEMPSHMEGSSLDFEEAKNFIPW